MGTIEIIEGFDDIALTQAPQNEWQGAWTSVQTGRFGGQAFRLDNQQIYRNLVGDARYTFGFAYRLNTMTTAATGLITLYEQTVIHGTLRYNSGGTFSIANGAGTVLATSGTVVTSTAAWYYIEFDYKVGDSDGEYELKVNGASVIARATSVDTRNAGVAGIIDRFGFICPSAHRFDLDDVIVTRGGGFQGDCRVITQFPNATGTNTAWDRYDVPRFQAAGTKVEGIDNVTPAWPAHEPGDIAILTVETVGGQTISLGTPAGFTEVSNSPQTTGTGTAGTKLAVYWCRATSNAMASPTVTDPGDHAVARIYTFRGLLESGDPVDVTSGGVKAVASATFTATGVTTTQANDMVVVCVAWDIDNAGPLTTSWTNANLVGMGSSAIGEAGTTQGTGGGSALNAGIKETAGATGDTTGSLTSSINAFITIALKANSGSEKFTVVDDSLFTVGDDADTTYMYSGTVGERETFSFPALGSTGTVKGLRVQATSRKDDAGTRKLATVVRRGTTNYDGTGQALSASYVMVGQIYEQDPSTSAAWTISGIDAGEYGVKVDS